MKRYLKSIKKRVSLLKVGAGVLAYLLIVFVYMQPVIVNGCDETFLGSPGDQSAFAWLYRASPNSSPLWGWTNWTNAPYGEDLSEPFNVTGLTQYVPIWLIQKVVGPTCAFNIHASFGYIFTATVMFLFVLWLTNRRSYFIAWLAGFLVAFSPYLQVKTLIHVSYVYSGLLILLLWFAMLFWRKPRTSLAIGTAVMGAILFYHDPYFIMLGIFLILSVIIGVVIYAKLYERLNREELRIRLKYLLFALPVFLILVSPVIYIRITQSKHIESVVGDSRGSDIMEEGRAYSSRPWDFVLPAHTNPLLPSAVKEFQDSHQHGSNYGESTLFLGFTSITLASVYIVYWFLRGRLRKGIEYRKQQLATLIASMLVLVGGLMSLPPSVHIGPIVLYFPSWLLLSLTTMWRVPARFFELLQIGLVILAVFGFLYIIQRYKERLGGKKLYIVYGLVFLFSMIEFATINPFHRTYWTQSMIPSVYSEVKNSKDVHTIAEYPMLDPPRNYVFIFYLSYQSYYQKSMINSAKVGSSTKEYRESMADLSDWQTPGALKRLNVGRVLVHGNTDGDVLSQSFDKLERSYDNQAASFVTEFKINQSIQPKNYLLAISQGFDGPSNYGFTNIDYYMHKSGALRPVLLPGAKPEKTATARIEYYGFEKMPRSVKFMQDGKVVAEVESAESKQVVEFTVDPSKLISIVPTNPPADYSFVVSNMEIK